MSKIEVKICTGTLCYVMGGSELQLLGDFLAPELQDRVEIVGSTCLDFCNKSESGRAPYVLVGGQLVCQATIAKVINEIEKQLDI